MHKIQINGIDSYLQLRSVGSKSAFTHQHFQEKGLYAASFDPILPPNAKSLFALPDTQDELIRHYTFSEADLSVIRQRRGAANRLGFAVQLCYLRFPGIILGADETPLPAGR